jgi:sialate O-acetylesterase
VLLVPVSPETSIIFIPFTRFFFINNTMRFMKKTSFSLVFVLLAFLSMANVNLPKIFGDNMVLQRNKPISIWGWASPGEKLTIQFNKQTKTTKTNKSGKWQLYLDAEPAGGPYQLLVKGKNQVSLQNILVGEVWICSGQSNMEMPIAGWGKIDRYQEEIASAEFPQIRHFKVPNTISTTLKEDITGGQWDVCSPATAGDFSATAYFFAREIYQRLKVPVGLINTSWGGTQSEAWTSKKAFEEAEYFKKIAAEMNEVNIDSLNKARKDVVIKNIKKAQGGEFSNNANTSEWKNISFEDQQWPAMKLPGTWEEQGFAGLDGIVWFRKIIEVDVADAGKPAVLELAKIDDIDETYMNGIKVGGSSQWDEYRKYSIPAGVLTAGKNLIAVKIKDNQGGGGIYGEATAMKITIGTSVQSLTGTWKFRIASVMSRDSQGMGPNDYPSVLFNAMINPLLPYTIQGAIWYQGESNAGRAFEYRTAFPLMINDWRNHWNKGNFPFLFVQLSTYGKADADSNNGSTWAELREAQAMTLSLPHTGMAVTTDIGDPKDIHPKNKRDVGKRLALIALHDVYQLPGEYTGPVYQSHEIKSNRIVLTFTHTGSGLFAKDKYGYARGFEIAGNDKVFHYARAIIEGTTITLQSDAVMNPVSARYNWADDASEGNIFNKESLPMAPFRTDNWDGVTLKNKYGIGW